MQKKILLQLFLFLLFFVSASIFLKTYFFNTEDKIVLNKNDQKKVNEDENRDKSNTIYNIKYISKDKKGNSYTIKSNSGEIDSNKSELISMNDVTANINLLNSSPIIISADNAIYNNINHETNFYNNVKVRYVTANITSENMDLLFEKNVATITNNVIYKNLNTQLQADKVEIDLITKNSKIFMNSKSEKVRIISLN
jgi:lipopolysaccharide export system protein LptC